MNSEAHLLNPGASIEPRTLICFYLRHAPMGFPTHLRPAANPGRPGESGFGAGSGSSPPFGVLAGTAPGPNRIHGF